MKKKKNVEAAAAAAKHEEISPLSLAALAAHFSASSTKNKKKKIEFMNNIILIEKNENVDFDRENENDLIEKCFNRETTYFFASAIDGPTSPPISISKKKIMLEKRITPGGGARAFLLAVRRHHLTVW